MRKTASLRVLVCVCTGLLLPSFSGAQLPDTIYKKTPLFTIKDVLMAGAFAGATVAISPVDRYFASRLQDSATQSNRWLHGAATGFRLLGSPGTIVTGTGIYLIGRASNQKRTTALGVHSLEAIVLSDLAGGGMKAFFGRARPFVDVSNPYNFQIWRGFKSDNYRSFPSGHTINAFAFASTVSRETEIWWPHSRFYIGTVMYGGATLVGLSRMYNNQHWASDVIGGAAVGTLMGLKVVKYTHSHPGNRVDRKLLSVSFTPSETGARPHISVGF